MRAVLDITTLSITLIATFKIIIRDCLGAYFFHLPPLIVTALAESGSYGRRYSRRYSRRRAHVTLI